MPVQDIADAMRGAGRMAQALRGAQKLAQLAKAMRAAQTEQYQPNGGTTGGGSGGAAAPVVSTLAAIPDSPLKQELIKKGLLKEGMPAEQALAILQLGQMRGGVAIDIEALMKEIQADFENYSGDIFGDARQWMTDLYDTAAPNILGPPPGSQYRNGNWYDPSGALIGSAEFEDDTFIPTGGQYYDGTWYDAQNRPIGASTHEDSPIYSDSNSLMFTQDPIWRDSAGGLSQIQETAEQNLQTDLNWFRKQQAADQAYYDQMMAGIASGTIPLGEAEAGGGGGGGGGGRGFRRYGGGGGGGSSGGGDVRNTMQIDDTFQTTAKDQYYENFPGFYRDMLAAASGTYDLEANPEGYTPEILDMFRQVQEQGITPERIEELQFLLDTSGDPAATQQAMAQRIRELTEESEGWSDTEAMNRQWRQQAPAEWMDLLQSLEKGGYTQGDNPYTGTEENPELEPLTTEYRLPFGVSASGIEGGFMPAGANNDALAVDAEMVNKAIASRLGGQHYNLENITGFLEKIPRIQELAQAYVGRNQPAAVGGVSSGNEPVDVSAAGVNNPNIIQQMGNAIINAAQSAGGAIGGFLDDRPADRDLSEDSGATYTFPDIVSTPKQRLDQMILGETPEGQRFVRSNASGMTDEQLAGILPNAERVPWIRPEDPGARLQQMITGNTPNGMRFVRSNASGMTDEQLAGLLPQGTTPPVGAATDFFANAPNIINDFWETRQGQPTYPGTGNDPAMQVLDPLATMDAAARRIANVANFVRNRGISDQALASILPGNIVNSPRNLPAVAGSGIGAASGSPFAIPNPVTPETPNIYSGHVDQQANWERMNQQLGGDFASANPDFGGGEFTTSTAQPTRNMRQPTMQELLAPATTQPDPFEGTIFDVTPGGGSPGSDTGMAPLTPLQQVISRIQEEPAPGPTNPYDIVQAGRGAQALSNAAKIATMFNAQQQRQAELPTPEQGQSFAEYGEANWDATEGAPAARLNSIDAATAGSSELNSQNLLNALMGRVAFDKSGLLRPEVETPLAMRNYGQYTQWMGDMQLTPEEAENVPYPHGGPEGVHYQPQQDSVEDQAARENLIGGLKLFKDMVAYGWNPDVSPSQVYSSYQEQNRQNVQGERYLRDYEPGTTQGLAVDPQQVIQDMLSGLEPEQPENYDSTIQLGLSGGTGSGLGAGDYGMGANFSGLANKLNQLGAAGQSTRNNDSVLKLVNAASELRNRQAQQAATAAAAARRVGQAVQGARNVGRATQTASNLQGAMRGVQRIAEVLRRLKGMR